MNDRVWLGGTVRYGSGLPVEFEGDVDKDELEEQFGPDTVAQVDFANGRVRYNVAVDLGAGISLWRRGERRLTLRVEAANVTNRLNVINFAGLFSGTAVGAPRSVAIRGHVQF
jgi:outer membrane receptor for Fe3+-dicitrate